MVQYIQKREHLVIVITLSEQTPRPAEQGAVPLTFRYRRFYRCYQHFPLTSCSDSTDKLFRRLRRLSPTVQVFVAASFQHASGCNDIPAFSANIKSGKALDRIA